MNPEPEQDLEQRKRQLEVELNREPSAISQTPEYTSPTETSLQTNTSTLPSQLKNFFEWFNNLSGLGKLIVTGVAAIVGLVILRTVFKLVAAVISLAVLAVLLYVAYQFFIVRSPETKD